MSVPTGDERDSRTGKTKHMPFQFEPETSTCPYCSQDVVSYWSKDGCLSRPLHYVLVADWIFHSECWDKQVMSYPPVDVREPPVASAPDDKRAPNNWSATNDEL